MHPENRDPREVPPREPVEGNSGLGFPGPDRPAPASDPGEDLPQRLAERISAGGAKVTVEVKAEQPL